MDRRGGTFALIFLIFALFLFIIIIFEFVPGIERKVTGHVAEDIQAERVPNTDLYLITDDSNPSKALFDSGGVACESVGKTCEDIKVNCSNIGQGNDWEDSSSNCATSSDEYTGCIYAAECLAEQGEENESIEEGNIVEKIKEFLSQTSILIIIVILIIAIILVATIILKKFNEEE